MSAKLRYNPDHSAVEVTVGEEVFGDDVAKGDECIIFPGESGNSLYVALEGSDIEGVEPNTVYELVKVTTILAEDSEIEFDDEPEN